MPQHGDCGGMMGKKSALILLCLGLAAGAPAAFSRAQPPQLPEQVEELKQPQKLPAKDTADPANQPVDLVEFHDVPLQEAMRLLSQQTGVKIVPSADAGKSKVSLYLKDVTPLVAVDEISRANGLIYRRDADTGVLRIFTTKENQRDLASFREDNTEVFTMLYPNAVNV